MTSDQQNENAPTIRQTGKIPLLYLFLGAVWILAGDWWVASLGLSPDGMAVAQTAKGWLFVFGTSALLYILIRNHVHKLVALNRHLAESERRYRSIVEDQTQFIVRWTPDFKRTFANESYCRYFGSTREELIGKDFLELVPEEDKEAVRQKIRSLTPSNPVLEDTHRVLRPDGSIGWQTWIDRGIFDESGRLTELQSTGADVTERVLAEEALRESEERFRRAMTGAPIPIIIFSEDGTIVFLNERWEEITGYSRKELITIGDWTERAYGGRRETVERGINRLFELDRRVDEGEFEIRCKSGEIRTWNFSSAPMGRCRNGLRLVMSTAVDVTERKKVEEALREQTLRLQSILDHAPLIVVFLGPDNRVEYVNPAVETLLGYTLEEAKSDDIFQRQYPSASDRREVLEFIQNGHNEWRRFGPKNKNGETRDMEWFNLRMSGGGKLGIGIDITERVRFERDLLQKTHLLETILDNIPVMVALMDSSNRLEYVNRAVKTQLGYTMGDNHPSTIFERVYPDPAVRAEVLSFVNRGEKVWREFKNRRKDGTEIDALWFNVVLDDGSKLGIGMDITERKRAERELRESEARLRNTLMASRDGIWENDFKNHKYYFNDRMFAMLGYDPLPPREGYRLFRNKLHPEDAERYRSTIRRFVESGEEYFVCEFRLLAADGAWRHILSRGRCLERDPKGRAVHLIGTHTDVTEMKELEHRLYQAQKMESIGRLAGGVAHDFNNLLMAIKGYGEFALERCEPGTPIHGDLGEVLKAADRAASLTRQLLAFSRKQVLQPQVLNLNDLLTNLEKMLRRLIGEDIEYCTLPAPDLWLVRADPGQLEQAIINMAVNARDAMPSGGCLTVETTNTVLDGEYAKIRPEAVPGEYVLLAVSDNGCGMAPEVMKNIFEPFFTTKETGKGTGLGLSTVHGIVKQSGGHIAVYSEEGKGTTFKIYLPRVNTRPDEPERDSPAASIFQSTAAVLVVEDEDLVRSMIDRSLRDRGFETHLAASGREALETLRALGGAVDLLITDVVMPRMGGRALAEEAARLYPHIQVLFMSGYTANAVVHHGILDEGIHFLQKPFTPDLLLKKIHQILGAGK